MNQNSFFTKLSCLFCTEVLLRRQKEKLEKDKYEVIEKLDNTIDEYLERYETLKETKDEALPRAEHASVQEIKSTNSNTTEQTP